MKRYWTSDLHLSHANITIYCNRPTLHVDELDEHGRWKTPEIAIDAAIRMDNFIIKNINSRVKSDDTVIHVGDFMNKGKCRGDLGLKHKDIFYLEQLNGTWSLLLGNHDSNNGVRTIGKSMFIDIGPYTAFVAHYPVENLNNFNPKLFEYVVSYTDFQICGHVHNAWKHKFHIHGQGKYLMYNVGIDAHKYVPITDNEIIGDVSRLLAK